jgi:hypothetical protein
MRAYEHVSPVSRVLQHIRQYASTFYSVHRRKHLIASFAHTEITKQNVIFFQYLSSCLMAYHGKVSCMNELFYVRQGHSRSWSAALKSSSHEHWPLLITSKDFSSQYQGFKRALLDYVYAGASPEPQIDRQVDEAAVELFRRSFCGFETDNPDEMAFRSRIDDPVSKENQTLRSIVGFALQYPEAY